MNHNSILSCQKGPTRHAYAWQIGPFWQDTLELLAKFSPCTRTVEYPHPRLLPLLYRSIQVHQFYEYFVAEWQICTDLVLRDIQTMWTMSVFAIKTIKQSPDWQKKYNSLILPYRWDHLWYKRTLFGNKIADRSDVFGASPVVALITSSFSILHLVLMDWAKTTARRDWTP